MMFFLSSVNNRGGALFRALLGRVITLKFNLCIIQGKEVARRKRPVSWLGVPGLKERGEEEEDVRRSISMERNYFLA